jgi:hypothetical protein
VAFQTYGERTVAYRDLVKNRRERDHLVDSGTDRRILKKLFSRSEMSAWILVIWLRIGTGRKILAMR